MELRQGLRPILRKGLLSAFPTRDSLEIAVSDAIDENLDQIVSRDKNLEVTVNALIEWARSREKLVDLFEWVTQGSENAELRNAHEALMSKGSFRTLMSPVRGSAIQPNFDVWVSVMNNPRVQGAVLVFRHDFDEVTEQLHMIQAYKDLHDGLHEMQLKCLDLIEIELESYPDSIEARDNVVQYLVCLQTTSNDIRGVVARRWLRPEETNWVEEHLMPVRRSMEIAVDNLDQQQLRSAVRLLSALLAVRPAQINSWLYSAARDLRLGRLVEQLRAIILNSGHVQGQRNVSLLSEGVNRLAELDTRLDALVRGHNSWQEIDDYLLLIARSISSDPDVFRNSWPTVKTLAEPLYRDSTEPELRNLRDIATRLDNALNSGAVSVTEQFRRFRSQARDRFYRVDLSLKKQCDELPGIVGPLNEALSRNLQ
jgi:hypothetical protein